VWGERDSLFRVEGGEAMLRALPRATLTVVPGAGHGVQWEKPHEFVEAVAAFRARFPPEPAAPLPSGGGGAQDRGVRPAS
jgi:hypothetical protein